MTDLNQQLQQTLQNNSHSFSAGYGSSRARNKTGEGWSEIFTWWHRLAVGMQN